MLRYCFYLHYFIKLPQPPLLGAYSSRYISLYNKNMGNIFSFCSTLFIKKFTLAGKGYRVYSSKRTTVTYQLGLSHISYSYALTSWLTFFGKYNFILYSRSYNKLNDSSYHLRNIRYANIFTTRGLRFKRQVLFKKDGKISSYR